MTRATSAYPREFTVKPRYINDGSALTVLQA